VADLGWILANLGVTVFTLLAVVLVGYLCYSMLHPERF
jgi:K+-transporting ATPase KdpF subunit